MKRFLALICLISSCTDVPKKAEVKVATPEEQLVHSPSTYFPAVSYDSVALFSVNPIYYKSEDIEVLEKKVMTAPYTDGLAIIDSTGKPTSKHYSRFGLSNQEQAEVREMFHLPPNNGEIEKLMCIPFYRDVFVFYRNQKQVAQAQICLQCRQAYLTPDTNYLAERLTTDADWRNMQSLIEKVKAN